MVHGSWLKAHGSCLKARSSRPRKFGARARVLGDLAPNFLGLEPRALRHATQTINNRLINELFDYKVLAIGNSEDWKS